MTDLRARAAMAASGQVVTDEQGRTTRDIAAGETITAQIGETSVALPDLAESGIDASADVPVHTAWSRVMGEVQFIRKDSERRDPGGRYNFRGIDAVLQAVGPALRKHGVAVVQTGVQPTYERVQTGGGKTMQLCRVTVTYAVIGPKGDMLPVPLVSVGEAFDSGDKSTPKAVSVALRSLYINNLVIPTNEPRMDPEHGPQYEIATPKPPTAEEYREEISRESTSLDRLREIREELRRNPAIANTVVDDVDGTSMPLTRYLTKVGTSRAEQQNAARQAK